MTVAFRFLTRLLQLVAALFGGKMREPNVNLKSEILNRIGSDRGLSHIHEF